MGNICKESIFWNFLNLFDFIEAMRPYIEAEYMHQVPLLISERSPIRPNFKLLKGNVNTRSSQAQPLYKIDKLVATGGPFKPELSILESCCASRYGKGQGCLLTNFGV